MDSPRVAAPRPRRGYVAATPRPRRGYVAAETAESPQVREVCADTQPKLRRAAALDADLAFYRRKAPAATARAEAFATRSKATTAYCALLDAWPSSGPRAEALVAHLYTRYLGDLSGGQILRRAVARAYDLAPPGGTQLDAKDGVAFYDFHAIGPSTKLRRFKDAYRATLDRLDVADPDLVVSEAVDAFRRNTALLKELDFVVLGAAAASARHARPTRGGAAACPFLAREGISDASGTCPVTGQKASEARAAPGASFGLRDVGLVAVLVAAMFLLIRAVTPSVSGGP